MYQSNLKLKIRLVFAMLMSSFYLGLIGPRPIRQGGSKRAVWERVNVSFGAQGRRVSCVGSFTVKYS